MVDFNSLLVLVFVKSFYLFIIFIVVATFLFRQKLLMKKRMNKIPKQKRSAESISKQIRLNKQFKKDYKKYKKLK